jgi:signal transduction histidine kinase
LTIQAQLIGVFVTLVVLLTAILGGLAYRTSRKIIQHDAVQTLRVATQAREQMLLRLLTRHRERAEDFLRLNQLACRGTEREKNRCLGELLGEFVAAEGAFAARFERVDAPAISVGERADALAELVKPLKPPPGQLARLFSGSRGQRYFLIHAVSPQGETFTFLFNLREIFPIFENFALGESGEIYLTDAEGSMITPLRFPLSSAVISKQIETCLAGADGTRLGPDYRGIDSIHVFRYVKEIGGGCIKAKISQAEAFAPAIRLRTKIAEASVLFAVLAIVFSLALARTFTGPIAKLNRRARALQAGDFDSPVPIQGPAEVRTFAETFASMASSIRRSRADLQRKSVEAQEANRVKSQFLSTVSHELRTPLNAIIGYSVLLKDPRHRETAKKQEEMLGRIHHNAMVLLDLINSVLDFSKIEAGKISLQIEAISLRPMIEQILSALKLMGDEKGLRFQLIDDPTVPTIRSDPGKIRQIFINLISNAIKFTEKGSVTVSIAHLPEKGRVVVVVSDTGAGISEEDLSRIFQPFFQADPSDTRAYAGTGLGLTIVKHFVTLVGGTIEVKSRPGAGSSFAVFLPYTLSV